MPEDDLEEHLALFVGEAIKQKDFRFVIGDFSLHGKVAPNGLAAIFVALARVIHEELESQPDFDADIPPVP
jgi:hypothetical protein